jgi:hypothetical protein
MIVIAQQSGIAKEKIDKDFLNMAMAIPGLFISYFLLCLFWCRRVHNMLTDLGKHRDGFLVRINRLLTAAALSDDEVAIWLARVPTIPGLGETGSAGDFSESKD